MLRRSTFILLLGAAILLPMMAYAQPKIVPSRDAASSFEDTPMPANSLSKQYPHLYLTAQTEAALSRQRDMMVPVLVKFKMSNTPAGTAEEISSDIRSRKQTLMSEIATGTNVQIHKSFTYSPYISMLAHVEDLHKMLAMPDIESIMEDELSQPYIAESIQQVNAAQLHTEGINGTGCAIAVLDTGIDDAHPMFDNGKVVASACFGTNYTLPMMWTSSTYCPNGLEEQESFTDGAACGGCSPFDLLSGCFHGNHVAGIAAGNPWDLSFIGLGQWAGVASGSKLIGISVFSKFDYDTGDTDLLSFVSDQIAALEWVYEHRDIYNIGVVNMSLGGGRHLTACDDDPRAGIIQMLRRAGVATVIASGNDGFDDAVGTPACISAAISVGSVSRQDAPSPFSDSGPGLIDLTAPGEFIYSAYGTDNGDNYIIQSSGTSMAAPHVAGAFAVLKSQFPSASIDEIENILKQTGVQTADGPRIDVGAAVAAMAARRSVPTLGQWSIISCGLLLLIVSTVVIRRQLISDRAAA